ncbi:MAG: T9SS type A sorting domain-containing protein, partial [Bacteroidota bacterium]
IDNTGMEDESWIQTKIFPNPATNQVFVMSSSQIQEITLSNMIGQTILKVPVNKENTVTLQTGDIPKGMYIISVQTSKKIHTQKIEIQ